MSRKFKSPIVPSSVELESILSKARERQLQILSQGGDYSWVDERMPKTLPESWTIKQRDPVAGLLAISRTELTVIMSGNLEADGRRWIHLSCGRRERMPNWEDLKTVKSLFLGDEATAIQVFPPQSQWVNIHKFVLHLWSPVDDLGLPDFTQGTGSI